MLTGLHRTALLRGGINAALELLSGPDPYMFAANRQGRMTGACRIASSGGFEYGCHAAAFMSPPYEIRSPRLCYPAVYCDTAGSVEHAIGNDIEFEGVSIEVAGVRTPVTVNGASSWTVTNGSYVWTDANSIVIPANTQFRVISATHVASGYRLCPIVANQNVAVPDGLRNGATTQSAYLTGSGTITQTTGNIVAPVLIVAKGWKAAGSPPVPLIIGDSIAEGTNDRAYRDNATGLYGPLAKGMYDAGSSTRYAYANMAVSGSNLANFSTAGNFAIRKQMLLDMDYPFTSIVSQTGINEAPGTAFATNWPAYGVFLKTLGNKPVAQMTICPKSTATDADLRWTTVGNQVLVDHSAANTWIRALQTNMDAYIEMAGYIDSAYDSGLWKGAPFTAALTSNFTSGTRSLAMDGAPTVGDNLVLGAGIGLYKDFGIVQTVTGASSPYTVQVINNVTAVGYNIGCVVNTVYTADGIHPATAAVELEVGAIIAAKNAGKIV